MQAPTSAGDPLARARRAAAGVRAALGVAPNALVPGRTLVEALATAQGLSIAALPPGDPLLAGARALFDRSLGLIAYAAQVPAATQTFSVAHELGHATLHSDAPACA